MLTYFYKNYRLKTVIVAMILWKHIYVGNLYVMAKKILLVKETLPLRKIEIGLCMAPVTFAIAFVTTNISIRQNACFTQNQS